ncbi:chorismate-binding protein [Aquimarina sp. M1]
MDTATLYTKVQSHWDQGLPFVVYRKPEERELHCFLQNDNQVYQVGSYDVSGFIFSPFNDSDKTILMSIEKSSYYSAETTGNRNKVLHNTRSVAIDHDRNGKEQYMQLVRKAISAIAQGSLKKVVLSRKEEVPLLNTDPIKIFQQLLDSYSNAFVYCWFHPAIGIWLGATPETLVTIKDNQFFTMSLAGTQPFIDKITVDWGVKEIEEQAMVTDYIVNGLSSKVRTIEKSKTYTHKAGSLLHLRTDIKGRLSSDNFIINDIIKTLQPTPAVCGLPKEEATSFIVNNESYDRKFYTGFLGELNMSKNQRTVSDLFVNLRCMEVVSNKAIIYVGGGITKDSIPENEWEETVKKTATMKKVLY